MRVALAEEAQQVGAVEGLRAAVGRAERGADGGAGEARLRGERRAGGVGRQAAIGLEAMENERSRPCSASCLSMLNAA
jgi:hypothetical protein